MPKMISTTKVPVSRAAASGPSTVTTGIRAFFSAWMMITVRLCSPLARAVRM
jgi:hypothetical protein